MIKTILQIDEPFETVINSQLLEKAVQVTIDWVKPNSSLAALAQSVNLVITDDETIQQLNAQYRGFDTPTDVLSFENTPDPDFPEVDPDLVGHLGDIIVAYPIAVMQAQAAGHTPQEETILLTIHGMLHLLGFDHDTPDHKTQMWQAQQQIMTGLGLAHVHPTEI